MADATIREYKNRSSGNIELSDCLVRGQDRLAEIADGRARSTISNWISQGMPALPCHEDARNYVFNLQDVLLWCAKKDINFFDKSWSNSKRIAKTKDRLEKRLSQKKGITTNESHISSYRCVSDFRANNKSLCRWFEKVGLWASVKNAFNSEKECGYCKGYFENSDPRVYHCSLSCRNRSKSIDNFYSKTPHLLGPKILATRSRAPVPTKRPVARPARCSDCRELKNPECFYVVSLKAQNSLSPRCKQCVSVYRKKTRQRYTSSEKDKILEKRSIYRKINRSALKEKSRVYNELKKIKLSQKPLKKRISKSFLLGRQSTLEAGRLNKLDAWKDWLSLAPSDYLDDLYKSNPHKDYRVYASPNDRAAAQYRYRYANDPEFNAMERVKSSVKKLATGKMKYTYDLVGYSSVELRQHLESLFTEEMNWDVFLTGKIHIDHVIPKSVFDHLDEDEIKDCWSLDNLRPMWAAENLKKRTSVFTQECCPILWMKYGNRISSEKLCASSDWQ